MCFSFLCRVIPLHHALRRDSLVLDEPLVSIDTLEDFEAVEAALQARGANES